MTSPWMGPREAALYLGRKSKTSWRSIQQMAREGKIKAGFDGKRFLFKTEDLDSWLYLNGKEQSHG